MEEHVSETSDTESIKKEKKTSKRTNRSRGRDKTSLEKGLLLLELAEIKEISDRIFERIEKKIEVLKALEASVDEKISALRKLGQETISEAHSEGIDQRNIVLSLNQKGLGIEEISSVLKIPKGEVELILSLHEGDKDIHSVSDLQREKKISIVKPQNIKDSYKRFYRKLLWVVPLFLVVISAYVYYSYFFKKEDNNISLNSQVSEQGFTFQEELNPEDQQQILNPEEEKAKAIDLIRKKYIISSGSARVEEVNKEVLEKKEGHIQKGVTSGVKEKELNEGKKIIIVITKSATIRADHSLNSEPVTWVAQGVSFEVKEEFTDNAGKKWYKIITSDGKEGWIADKVVNQL